jgi:hypothetical protein
VASAGDLNGDGYGDVIVGAYQYDGTLSNEGRAFVFLGSPAGLASAAVWMASGNQAGAGFGMAVASAGDVNHDGYSDLIVGAPFFESEEMQDAEGAAYVLYGCADSNRDGVCGGGPGPDGGVSADGGLGVDGGPAADGGSVGDGGAGGDGGTSADGGAGEDGGAGRDGGLTPDAGLAADGGPNRDGGLAADGGRPSDGGAAPAGAAGQGGGGCGILLNTRPQGGTSVLLPCLGAVLLAKALKRRRRPSEARRR